MSFIVFLLIVFAIYFSVPLFLKLFRAGKLRQKKVIPTRLSYFVKLSILYFSILIAIISFHFAYFKSPAEVYFKEEKQSKSNAISWKAEENLSRIISDDKSTFPLSNRLRDINSSVDEYSNQSVTVSVSTTAPVAESKIDTANLKGKVIVIDPGHGNSNNLGAVGPGGLTENFVVLEIAKLLKDFLEDDLAAVYLTRDSATTDMDNKVRGDYANSVGADIFVRIHADPDPPNTETQRRGFIISWYKDNSKDAAYIFEKYLKQTNRHSLGMLKVYSEGLEAANVPGITVDIAKITNEEEEALLKNKDFLRASAKAMRKAIKEFLINFSN